MTASEFRQHFGEDPGAYVQAWVWVYDSYLSDEDEGEAND
jgi:hypothetical protein